MLTADPPLVLRRCNSCGCTLRPATPAEVTAERDGHTLPDVRRDCPACAPVVTREDLAALAVAFLGVRTGSVVDMPLDAVERSLRLAADLTVALRAVRDVRAGAAR
jgi:hypothetical protein